MAHDPDPSYDTTGLYKVLDVEDQASVLGRAFQQISEKTIQKAAEILRHELMTKVIIRPECSFMYSHIQLGKPGEKPTVSRQFTIVEGSLLLARQGYNKVGWSPAGTAITSLRDLQSIQDRLDVCLYLDLDPRSAYEYRFQQPKYAGAVWGDGGSGDERLSRAYFWNVALYVIHPLPFHLRNLPTSPNYISFYFHDAAASIFHSTPI
ncbi:hypothetical protein F5Y00DRAFT_226466 [Daldinia vernicosa]|uniref:uncharacterized protein n=1 Tax=Daldinia vernicosa TaxID=114800 RepID=UPI00200835C1|nr:uncharacterized protein F5Y00DRAFT_226466 [Daldinia vernicosa]KAI0852971.1 hypothetical protein F5Y00DRAFT_226466 [Daldinia vernicosa]